jgi:hypothetical protein
MISEAIEIVYLEEDDQILCTSCETITIPDGVRSIEGTLIPQYKCMDIHCGKKILVKINKKKPEYKCHHCNNDLTKDGSVGRDYCAHGKFDENGHYIKTDNFYNQDLPDRCTSCWEEVHI